MGWCGSLNNKSRRPWESREAQFENHWFNVQAEFQYHGHLTHTPTQFQTLFTSISTAHMGSPFDMAILSGLIYKNMRYALKWFRSIRSATFYSKWRVKFVNSKRTGKKYTIPGDFSTTFYAHLLGRFLNSGKIFVCHIVYLSIT